MIDFTSIMSRKQLESHTIESIIESSENIIKFNIKRIMPNQHYEDGLQIGRLAVVEAVKCYKEEKKCNFYKFLKTIIRRRAIDYVVRQNRESRRIQFYNISLDYPYGNGCYESLVDYIIDHKSPSPLHELILKEKDWLKIDLINYFSSHLHRKNRHTDRRVLIDYYVYGIDSCSLKKIDVRYDNIVDRFAIFLRKIRNYEKKNR